MQLAAIFVPKWESLILRRASSRCNQIESMSYDAGIQRQINIWVAAGGTGHDYKYLIWQPEPRQKYTTNVNISIKKELISSTDWLFVE